MITTIFLGGCDLKLAAEATNMHGAIGTWDILSHPWATVQCFGWRTFFGALAASSDDTFLDVLNRTHVFTPPPVEIGEALRRCITLEQTAERVYRELAEEFSGEPRIAQFFGDLAEQETDHAEMLQICRHSAGSFPCSTETSQRWSQSAGQLLKRMQGVVECVGQIHSPGEALALVLEIESSEVNRLFVDVTRTCSPTLAQGLFAFRSAADAHFEYILRNVPLLAPQLSFACEQFQRTVFLQAAPA